MKRSSIIDNLSFNSYAVEEDSEHRQYFKIKIMLLGGKCICMIIWSGGEVEHVGGLHTPEETWLSEVIVIP